MKNATDIIMNLHSEGMSPSRIARELCNMGVVNNLGNKYNANLVGKTIRKNKVSAGNNIIKDYVCAQRSSAVVKSTTPERRASVVRVVMSANYLDLEQKVQLIEDIYSM